MPPSPPPPRYATLDAWRGVAALAVLGFHAAGATLTPAHRGALLAPLRLLEAWGFLGVQLFFVVSGYCIAAAAASTRGPGATGTFLRRRARRVYPAAWASLAVAAAIGLLVRGLEAAGGSTRRFDPFAAGLHWVSTAALVEPALKTFGVDPDHAVNGPLWSLAYEVQFYLWVAWAWLGRGPRTRAVATVATTVAAVAVRLVPSLRPRGFLLDLWPQFLCGLWVHAHLHAPPRVRRAPRALALVGAVAAWAAAFPLGGAGSPQDAKAGFVCLGFAGLLVALHPLDAALARRGPVRALAAVGERSYSVYLTHLPVVLAVAGVAEAAGAGAGLAAWGVVLAAVAAAAAVACAFHAGVERRFLPRAARAAGPSGGAGPEAGPAAARGAGPVSGAR